MWWPLLPLAVAGVLVALTIRYLPGRGGHSPADGFKAGAGAPGPAELPGVLLAALATLSLGVVLGPEAPLIALGGGLGVLAIRLANRDAPARASAMVAAAGSFAAISTLLGSPLIGAFLLMEVSGLGGATLAIVSVVVAYVVSIRLSPAPAPDSAAEPAPEPASAAPPPSGSG
jgi:H+/Cl- antiporter ClcA